MCDEEPKLDHLCIPAPADQFESIVEWYKKALAPLNYGEMMRFPGVVGMGDKVPGFWLMARDECQQLGLHFAFSAPDHATVDAFHKAAIAAGGTCNGAPGKRPQYHENYYGAFVLDPLKNNVELVDHLPHTEQSTT